MKQEDWLELRRKKNPAFVKMKELIVDFIPFHWKEHCTFAIRYFKHVHTQIDNKFDFKSMRELKTAF